MDIIHCAEMPWGESLVAQRGGGDVAHKRLFEGEEGTPDNYMLVMAKEPNTYFSPRHRHPWDQIRFCLEGKIPIAKGLYVDGGEIAYFPESARYGPQEGGTNRIVLLLQFAGASGQSFIGPDKLKQARLELAQSGSFDGGVYTLITDSGRKNCDAYEAIWRHVKGGELSYAPPAYKTPIVMRPEALTWQDTSEAGVQVKGVGVFPHRGLTITHWKVATSAVHVISSHPALRFIFVTHGNGTIKDTTNSTTNEEALRRWSVVRLEPEQSAVIVTNDGLEFTEWLIEPVRRNQG